MPVTLMDFDGYRGEAMAIGERTPLALIDAAASCRMAVAEAVTNLAASGVARLTDLKLSANWMAPAGHPGEDAALYDGVRVVAMELCPALGIAIPVGKDSMSMRTTWRDQGRDLAVTAPVSLIVTAFAPVEDVRRALTPLLRRDCGDTDLLWIDLGAGKAARRLGAGAGLRPARRCRARSRRSARLAAFFGAMEVLSTEGRLLAYHDIGDGGLFATV
jgi:phosphoribosylformylglycinamidine synthase